MVFETNITTINPANSPHSYLIARMDSAKRIHSRKKHVKYHNSSSITGYLIDTYHDVIRYTFLGTPEETDKFLRDFPPSNIYSFSNLSVKQITNYTCTSSILSKELNLNKTQITPIPQNDSNKYNIPIRRPATETVKQIIHRMKSKKITNTLADITALILSSNNSKTVIKNNGIYYREKQIHLTDGTSFFDLTFSTVDMNDVLEQDMTKGNVITFLHAKVKFESNNNQKINFTLDTEITEIFPDNLSTQAKQLLKKKYTILEAHKNQSQHNFPKTTYPIINVQQLASYIRQYTHTKQRTQMATQKQTETPTKNKTSHQVYEIRNITITGLGRSNLHTLTYEGCSICKKKHKANQPTCYPNAQKRHYACCPNVEITDWSGTAFNLLAFGQTLLTLLNTKTVDETQRIANQNPDTLLFQTQTNILVEIYKDEYESQQQINAEIITAQKRNFTDDLGIISTTLPNNIERTNNIAFAFFKDIAYQNNELTIVQQPTTYIILYAIGNQNPHILDYNQTHKIINTVDVCSSYDESYTTIQAQCICQTNDLTRNSIHTNDHALLLIDHINFPPENTKKHPLANITAVHIIAKKKDRYATNKTLKQFITEAKHIKNALTHKPIPNP